DGACEPYELLGRYSLVVRSAFEYRVVTKGRALDCETRVGWPPPQITADAWHELALAIAGHRWPLPRQDRHQRQAAFVGRHGLLPGLGCFDLYPFWDESRGGSHAHGAHTR